MGRGIRISWIAVGQNTMDREVKVTCVGGRYACYSIVKIVKPICDLNITLHFNHNIILRNYSTVF
jgi:hypothetical protein